MGVTAGADNVDTLGTVFEGFNDFAGVEHFVADGVVDFVENHEIVVATVNRVPASLPTFLRQLDVSGIGFGTADFHEAAPHGANFEFVIAEHFGSVELTVVPRAFDELHHQDFEALAHGAKRGSKRAGGLAFARAGVNDEESFFFRHDLSPRWSPAGGGEKIKVCGLRREFVAVGGICVAENNPQAGAVGLFIVRANGAGELSDFQTRAADQVSENTASIVYKITESLGNEDGVNVAGRGLFELVKVVVGERFFERDFDGGGRLVLVRDDSNGHGGYGFTPRRLFRIGAARKNCEGAVELLGEHDAGEFVREGHRAERKLLVGALAETFREAIGVAAEENQFADAAVAELREPFGEGVRIEIFPGGVEKDDGGGAVGTKFLDGGMGIAHLRDFDGTGAADAFDVVIEDGTHLGAAGFAEHQKPNFHDGLVSPEDPSSLLSSG